MSLGIRGRGEPRGRSSGLGLNGKPGLLGIEAGRRPLEVPGFAREFSIDTNDSPPPTLGGDLLASSRGTEAGLAEAVTLLEV